MKAIYETRGRAREYCPLAVNLYTGCSHGCVYCYSPDVIHRDREKFHTDPQPRKGILEQLVKDADALRDKRQSGPVLLCFVCDPYFPLEETVGLTRQAIFALHMFGHKVSILTKGGMRAKRDFVLLGQGDSFGVTLTTIDPADSIRWEPGAALPQERIQSLWEAKQLGLETWVSCEPVIYPEATLELIRITHEFVDTFKVGRLNYIERLPPEFKAEVEGIDWAKFGHAVVDLLEKLGAKYYIKQDLAKWL